MRLRQPAHASQSALRQLARANAFPSDVDQSALELLEKHAAPPFTYFFQK
jgi:hypothetical protein